MARSKFRTHYGRARHHPMVTRRAVHHHGFLTRFHRPVTGSVRKNKRHDLLPREHKQRRIRSVHPGHVITRKAKKTAAVRKTKAHRSTAKLSHTKITGGRKVTAGHRATGLHAAGHAPAHHTGPRHLSAATKTKISHTLSGKRHPHRGHALSAAARRKIAVAVSARLKGRPHPHKGHHLSNAAREKMSRTLKAKAHTRHTARKPKRR
ncbi:NUMOD3 domain-containing DNA-binding protein [Amycolatopsis sp. CFH S0078]|uniref:NUMOD3 domain-containing DNA-binding protein n=1 Tax=Amycolatopsis sp. CFH S0078 TaxID=1644108 RepID=UPI00106EEE83|nr:NUMOD3 domain-containing DNA-binding protein [Amycolatopsis sp. CFH S0078]